MNTNHKGSITEAVVLAALARLGKKVLVPFGNYGDYDLVIDDAGVFKKIQCKTGRIRGEVLKFNGGVHGSGKDRYYIDDMDFYGVYCPDNGKTYIIPASECSKCGTELRLIPAKRPTSQTRYAKDFEV